MLKDKEKKALEFLKQTYLKNREEKTREAKNRFLGLSVFYKKSCAKDKIIFKNLKNKNTNGF